MFWVCVCVCFCMHDKISNMYPVHFSICFALWSGCGVLCVCVSVCMVKFLIYTHKVHFSSCLARRSGCGFVGVCVCVSVCMIRLLVCTQSTSLVVRLCDQVVDLCVCFSVPDQIASVDPVHFSGCVALWSGQILSALAQLCRSRHHPTPFVKSTCWMWTQTPVTSRTCLSWYSMTWTTSTNPSSCPKSGRGPMMVVSSFDVAAKSAMRTWQNSSVQQVMGLCIYTDWP